MNSTHSYYIRKIQGEYCHFIFLLNAEGIRKKLIFSNAEGFENRSECIGVEYDENSVPDDLFRSKICDSASYGTFLLINAGKYKITFSIKSGPLCGNYILLMPSWARNSARKIWKLIPANTL